MRALFVFLISLTLVSCSTEQMENNAKIDTFFDLEGTLDLVLTQLVNEKAMLKKTSQVDNESEESTLGPLNLEEWKAQLEIFYESDINKLGLENSYEVETLTAFDGIEKTIYSAKGNGQYVQTIECSFRDGKLFIVRIIARDKNFVYQIENELTLYFNHFKKKLALDHFIVKSNEQMLLRKDLFLRVEGEIVKP
jgi:hypothetical protein